MQPDDTPQWQIAIYTYIVVAVVMSAIIGISYYFDIVDQELSRTFGGIVALFFIIGFVIRLPISVGAFFAKHHVVLMPLGMALAMVIGTVGLVPACASFQFFASEFQIPLAQLLFDCFGNVFTSEFQWWHFATWATSLVVALLGSYGAFRGRRKFQLN